jgi:hypothetical protein
MPLSFRGHCPDCGHDWDGVTTSVDCGCIDFPGCDLRLIRSVFQAAQAAPAAIPPLRRARSFVAGAGGFWRFCLAVCKMRTFFQHAETYGCYVCSRCFGELDVPRRLNRRCWLPWVGEHAVLITRSQLVFTACERVARILAGARSRHVPVPIDIGSIECPDCGDPMAIGTIDTNSLVCPLCKSCSARRVPGITCWERPSGHRGRLDGHDPVCRRTLPVHSGRCPGGSPDQPVQLSET